jgi:hypothetical protein
MLSLLDLHLNLFKNSLLLSPPVAVADDGDDNHHSHHRAHRGSSDHTRVVFRRVVVLALTLSRGTVALSVAAVVVAVLVATLRVVAHFIMKTEDFIAELVLFYNREIDFIGFIGFITHKFEIMIGEG